MSSDLLAEFDSFYKSPQDTQPSTGTASNDLSFLSNTSENEQIKQQKTFTPWQSPTARSSEDIWSSLGNLQQGSKPATITRQEDIWGSFETIPDKSSSYGQNANKSQTNFGRIAPGPVQNKPGIVRRPTLDLFSGNILDMNDATPNKANAKSAYNPPQRPETIRKSSSGAEILFDAADELPEDDDDEFGDFETVAPSRPALQPFQSQPESQLPSGIFGATTLQSKSPKQPASLLSTSTSLNAGTLPYPQAPKSPSFQERNPFSELELATKHFSSVKMEEKPKSASPVTAWPSFEPKVQKSDPYQDSPAPFDQDEDWGDFADLPSETPAVGATKASSVVKADAWEWNAADQVAERPPPVDSAPPTNIPPPSVLLALFPPLFDLPQSTLFKAVANQTFSLKNRIISDPSTINFLRAYLLIATVAARIIAGRKLRWKRDSILSQAMKIGPAAAGGKGGMKLVGVDKAEATREDRESADVVRVWREHVGRLRSAVAVANSSLRDAPSHLVIPEINETLHVKSLEGALTAPKPCLICGIKRDERINKVDIQVEDSFGEWWIEHWGHRACRNFWLEHESKLKHR